MTYWLLALAGVGAGVCGSVAGLASLVSYPALLAAGLPPLLANVTNTTAMLGTGLGSWAASRRELRGMGAIAAAVAAFCAVGGVIGSLLLLRLPDGSFELVVPWLIVIGGVLILARDRIRARIAARRPTGDGQRSIPWRGLLALVVVGVYGGYFGAGAGIMILALLGVLMTESLAVVNALRNVATLGSNLAAVIVFTIASPVDWAAAAALGAGAIVGSSVGPAIVRRVPELLLRRVIAVAAFGLAISLAVG